MNFMKLKYKGRDIKSKKSIKKIMKKILISLSVIGAVAAIAVGGTIAYFSDTETSTGNTFTAGTIDIAVTSPQTWQYAFEDMKPSQVEYSNFTISNATGNNPVNVWKKVSNVQTIENGINEPEQEWYDTHEEEMNNEEEKNNIDTVIQYDLSVVVKDSTGAPKWNQTLYNLNKTIADIANQHDYGTFLGMIPAGWSMDVTESYHMIDETGNWAQSDQMTFDITVTGEQLTGTLVLSNKDPNQPVVDGWLVLGTKIGTLAYGVKDSKFNYSFTGVAPLTNTKYFLIEYKDPWGTPGRTFGSATTDGSGNVPTISGNVDLGADMINAKIWLVTDADYDEGANKVTGWNPANYLFETGLMDYYDSDL